MKKSELRQMIQEELNGVSSQKRKEGKFYVSRISNRNKRAYAEVIFNNYIHGHSWGQAVDKAERMGGPLSSLAKEDVQEELLSIFDINENKVTENKGAQRKVWGGKAKGSYHWEGGEKKRKEQDKIHKKYMRQQTDVAVLDEARPEKHKDLLTGLYSTVYTIEDKVEQWVDGFSEDRRVAATVVVVKRKLKDAIKIVEKFSKNS